MVFYKDEGTQFKYTLDEPDLLKLAKDKTGECFERWDRLPKEGHKTLTQK